MAAPTPQPEPTTPYAGLTFLQLQTLVGDSLGLTTTEMSAADLALVKALLNEAVARINLLFPALCSIRKYYTVTTTANQASYAAPVGIIHVHDPILLDGAPVYSIPTTYENQVSEPDVASTDLNTVRLYSMSWGVNDAAATATPKPILTFYPAPDETGTAEIWGTGHDNALSADADLLRIPVAYTSAPIYHAVQPLLAARSRTSDLANAISQWNDALAQIAILKNRTRTIGETVQFPNYMRSGRGARYQGTYRPVV